jgi:hypothetical protein
MGSEGTPRLIAKGHPHSVPNFTPKGVRQQSPGSRTRILGRGCRPPSAFTLKGQGFQGTQLLR